MGKRAKADFWRKIRAELTSRILVGLNAAESGGAGAAPVLGNMGPAETLLATDRAYRAACRWTGKQPG